LSPPSRMSMRMICPSANQNAGEVKKSIASQSPVTEGRRAPQGTTPPAPTGYQGLSGIRSYRVRGMSRGGHP
jgi:hypothetical protein